MGDRGVGEGDDLGRRPIIRLEPEDPRVGVPLGELEDVVVVRTPEAVDRLRVVADGRQVAAPRAGDGLDQGDLDGVRVLHLVDQDVAEHPPLRGPLVGELVDQPGPLAEQVVVVHAVGRALATGVGRRGGFEVAAPLGQSGWRSATTSASGLPTLNAKLIRCWTVAGFGAICPVPKRPASSIASRMRSSWSSLSRIVKFGP